MCVKLSVLCPIFNIPQYKSEIITNKGNGATVKNKPQTINFFRKLFFQKFILPLISL
jgi:hypothetical protein